jgi:hypothetical protein
MASVYPTSIPKTYRGNAYVTGTHWHSLDFPAITGPDVSANVERVAFVVKVAPWWFYLPLILK